MSYTVKSLIVAVLAFCVLMGVALAFSYRDCTVYGKITDRRIRFEVIGGCFVESDRGWFLKDQVYDQEFQR